MRTEIPANVFLGLAITFAFIALALPSGAVLCGWYAGMTTTEALKDFKDLALIFGAFSTFCTIVWRGMLTEKSIVNQENSIELRRLQQIADRNAAYASLFTEGAALLEDHSDHKKSAAIAILRNVIEDPEKRYSRDAVTLLANEWWMFFSDTKANDRTYIPALRDTLVEAKKDHKVSSDMSPIFVAPTPAFRWRGVAGFRRQEYDGGTFQIGELKNFDNSEYVMIRNCSIFDNVVEVEPVGLNGLHFDGCKFVGCKIVSLDERALQSCSFKNCNFSGAEFRKMTGPRIEELLKQTNFDGSYYAPGKPPKNVVGFDWSHYLAAL